MNKVFLQGHIGKKPELKTFDKGSIATFSVATNEGYYDNNKNWVEKTEWHNIVVNSPSAEKVSKYPQGTEVLIEGKLRTREYETKSKDKVRITEIVALRVKPFGLKQTQSTQGEPIVDIKDDDFPF